MGLNENLPLFVSFQVKQLCLNLVTKSLATFCLLCSIDIQINRLIVGPSCLPTLPIYFTNLPIHQFTNLHQFTNSPIYQFTNSPIYSTAKNGATYPSINIRGTGQKKIVLAVTNPPPSFLFFCYEWVTSALYIICGQKVKLKPIRCLCFALTLALPKVIESK